MSQKDSSKIKSEVDSELADSDYNTASDVRTRLKDIVDSAPNVVDGINAENLESGTVPDARLEGASPDFNKSTFKKSTTEEGPVYDVTHPQYGADPSNSYSSNQTAIQKAIDAASNTGGRVYIPAKSSPYEVEGLRIKDFVRIEGDGEEATQLQLPDTPSDHMFDLADSSLLESGGVEHIFADGGGTNSYDFLHFGDANEVERFDFSQCRVENFRRAYYGSGNTRNPVIHGVQILNCVSAIVIQKNHPMIVGCDIGLCDNGIIGPLYDCIIVNTQIDRCGVAIGPNGNGRPPRTSYFANVISFKNDIGFEVKDDVSIINSQIVSDTSSTEGVIIRGGHTTLTGSVFRGSSFTNAAVAIGSGESTVINSNVFNGIGTAVGTASSTTNTQTFQVSNNMVLLSSDRRAFNFNTFSDGLYAPTFSENEVRVKSDITAPVFDLSGVNFGARVQGNTVYSPTSRSGTWIEGDLSDGIVKDNRVREITNRNLTTNTNTIIKDNVTLS
jgi:hypothetical protein